MAEFMTDFDCFLNTLIVGVPLNGHAEFCDAQTPIFGAALCGV